MGWESYFAPVCAPVLGQSVRVAHNRDVVLGNGLRTCFDFLTYCRIVAGSGLRCSAPRPDVERASTTVTARMRGRVVAVVPSGKSRASASGLERASYPRGCGARLRCAGRRSLFTLFSHSMAAAAVQVVVLPFAVTRPEGAKPERVQAEGPTSDEPLRGWRWSPWPICCAGPGQRWSRQSPRWCRPVADLLADVQGSGLLHYMSRLRWSFHPKSMHAYMRSSVVVPMFPFGIISPVSVAEGAECSRAGSRCARHGS